MTDTLPVPITTDVVAAMDKPDAERLDKRIRLLVGAIHDNITKLYDLVEQAKHGQLHTALGYSSWTAYVADVFTIGVRLDREQRRELSVFLSGEGMSQRKIGSVVGVDQKTVCNDLHAGEENSSQTKLSRAEAEAVTARIRGWVDAKPAELDDDTAKQLLEAALAEQEYPAPRVRTPKKRRTWPKPGPLPKKATPDAQTGPVDLAEQRRTDHEGAIRRSVGRMHAFLAGYDQAYSIAMQINRSYCNEVLAQLSDLDRDRFRRIDMMTTWPRNRPGSTSDNDEIAVENGDRCDGRESFPVALSIVKNRLESIVYMRTPEQAEQIRTLLQTTLIDLDTRQGIDPSTPTPSGSQIGSQGQ